MNRRQRSTIARGKPAAAIYHRSVRQLHADLPAEVAAVRSKLEKMQARVAKLEAREADLTAQEQKRLATYRKREADMKRNFQNKERQLQERENQIDDDAFQLRIEGLRLIGVRLSSKSAQPIWIGGRLRSRRR